MLSLGKIAALEEAHLLAAHVAMTFGEHDSAQALFLNSSQPLGALHMRKALLHWEDALALARTLAPSELPAISRELGAQCEMRGEFEAALRLYEDTRALNANPSANPSPSCNPSAAAGAAAAAAELERLSYAGTARCLLRMGELAKGVQLAVDSGEPGLCRECASILEAMKQWADAALLFEKVGTAACVWARRKHHAAGAFGALDAPRAREAALGPLGLARPSWVARCWVARAARCACGPRGLQRSGARA